MAEPPPGAFPHQHRDPRGLRERIDAQLRDRLLEALEHRSLAALLEQRQREGRPAPDPSSAADRREWEVITARLLSHLRGAFDATLDAPERVRLAEAEQAHGPGRERLLAAQVLLARILPDYWQRLEQHQATFEAGGDAGPPPSGAGWLRRLFGGRPAEPDAPR
jgi:hypothetical protein